MPHQIMGTLLVSCPDRKGLIAALAQMLADHNLNIINTQQHTDMVAGMFFQRLRFDASQMDVSREDFEALLRIKLNRYDMAWRLSFSDEKKRMAIFVSKIAHCLYDLLLRHRLGELDCEIPLIISNHADLRPVANGFGIPFEVLPITKKNKRQMEDKQLAILEERKIDLVVLARYMQILSDDFVAHFPERIINIHHSTLPAFKGAKPYHQAFERGVKLIGATAHYATAELDEGPIIDQEVTHCSHDDGIDDLTRKGRDMERITLARAVRAHLEDRIIVYGMRTVVF